MRAQEGLTQQMMKTLLGWDEGEVGKSVGEMRREILSLERPFYHQMYIWTAQKPVKDTAWARMLNVCGLDWLSFC